mmetsp:Transcript_9436/g.28395  ORF Transcript_9436/g.28395 Transcript_9436/m.28395 type:complete len:224 (-) Transcript_9436:687-1358(-)
MSGRNQAGPDQHLKGIGLPRSRIRSFLPNLWFPISSKLFCNQRNANRCATLHQIPMRLHLTAGGGRLDRGERHVLEDGGVSEAQSQHRGGAGSHVHHRGPLRIPTPVINHEVKAFRLELVEQRHRLRQLPAHLIRSPDGGAQQRPVQLRQHCLADGVSRHAHAHGAAHFGLPVEVVHHLLGQFLASCHDECVCTRQHLPRQPEHIRLSRYVGCLPPLSVIRDV